jgi:GntR family transcriptional regulator / MocR family aminotransferase
MENTVDSGLNKENIPLYMRVYEYYKDLITEGKLSPGARLPSIRRCEKELSVSRTTAEAAYFQLAADGYVVSKPQSGYFVTDVARREKKDGTVRGKKELLGYFTTKEYGDHYEHKIKIKINDSAFKPC